MLSNISIEAQKQEEILKNFAVIYNDEKTGFSERLNHLYAAQMKAIEDYGQEGLMLVLEYELRLYMPDELIKDLAIFPHSQSPEECPWYALLGQPVKKAIPAIWDSFRVPFALSLAQYCKDLFMVQASDKWYVAYAYETATYDGQGYYEFLLGAEAEPNAQLPAELIEAGWKMPEDLKAFYKVHSIFGDATAALKNENIYCIATADKLKASLTFMEEVVKEQNDEQEYSFYDLLPFCEDGAGNSHNFYKAKPGFGSYATVDWDHETRELGHEMSFAEYIDYKFGSKLRGEW